jgi:hypothetical protein
MLKSGLILFMAIYAAAVLALSAASFVTYHQGLYVPTIFTAAWAALLIAVALMITGLLRGHA